ncbi:MATE family efflux transporter [Sphingomonas cynarae]|uniref:MATE family efflux transporter n=1 Tax=Sphingomonas cynarae TaxID=930197 RepID=A0ABP7EQ68_9SPHN
MGQATVEAPATRQARRRRLPVVPQIWLVAGGGWVGRIVQVVAQLLVVRILTDHLGVEGYGVFALLASLATWFTLSDLGVGVSLQNHISERRASGADTGSLVISASLLAIAACGFVTLLVALTGPLLARFILGDFGFLSPGHKLLVFYAMAFPGIGTALGSLLYRVWFAQHRGYLSNLMPAAGTILGTLGVWIASRTHIEPALSWSVSLFYAPIALLPIFGLGITLARLARLHRPSMELAKTVLRRALRFWLFGIIAATVLQVDFIIMAKVLSARDIVIYSIATRVFGLVFFVYNALLMGLWPMCSEAVAGGRWEEVNRMVRKYVALGAVFVILSGCAIEVTKPWIIATLAPSSRLAIPGSIVVLLTIYYVLRVWTDTFSTVIQSINHLNVLWIALPFQATFSVTFQVLGARWLGLEGMILGLILCFLLTTSWILPLAIHRLSAASPTAEA